MCEILAKMKKKKWKFKYTAQKKPVNIPVQCLIKKRCIQDWTQWPRKKINYSNMSLMIAKQFQGNTEIFS